MTRKSSEGPVRGRGVGGNVGSRRVVGSSSSSSPGLSLHAVPSAARCRAPRPSCEPGRAPTGTGPPATCPGGWVPPPRVARRAGVVRPLPPYPVPAGPVASVQRTVRYRRMLPLVYGRGAPPLSPPHTYPPFT